MIEFSTDNLPYEKVGKNEPVCIADEVPFEIPESWEWARLIEVCEYIQRGKSPKYSTIKKYPVIAQKCNQWDGFSIEKAKFIEPDSLQSYGEERLLQDNDLMWNSTGLGTLGRIAIYKSALNPYELAVADSHVTVIRPFKAYILPEYLYYYFANPSVQNVIEDKADGTTKQKELATATIKAYLIPIPPLDEQKRILEKLDEVLPIVEKYKVVYDTAESLQDTFPDRLKKSILLQAVQGKLVPQDPSDEPAEVLLEHIRAEKQRLIKEGKIKKDKHESIIFRRDNSHYEKLDGIERCIDDELPFEIPQNWKWCRLGSIAKVLGGKRIPAGRKLTNQDTGHVYIRVSDMKDGGISVDNLLFVPDDIYPLISKYIIKREDIFITVAGTIGRVGKIPAELDGANLTENADRLVFSIVDQDWLIMLLQSPFIQTQIIDATTKVGQPKLAIARIERLLIPLPPVSEQKRIVKKQTKIVSILEQL